MYLLLLFLPSRYGGDFNRQLYYLIGRRIFTNTPVTVHIHPCAMHFNNAKSIHSQSSTSKSTPRSNRQYHVCRHGGGYCGARCVSSQQETGAKRPRSSLATAITVPLKMLKATGGWHGRSWQQLCGQQQHSRAASLLFHHHCGTNASNGTEMNNVLRCHVLLKLPCRTSTAKNHPDTIPKWTHIHGILALARGSEKPKLLDPGRARRTPEDKRLSV